MKKTITPRTARPPIPAKDMLARTIRSSCSHTLMQLELVLDVRANIVCLGKRLQKWQQLQQTPAHRTTAHTSTQQRTPHQHTRHTVTRTSKESSSRAVGKTQPPPHHHPPPPHQRSWENTGETKKDHPANFSFHQDHLVPNATHPNPPSLFMPRNCPYAPILSVAKPALDGNTVG